MRHYFPLKSETIVTQALNREARIARRKQVQDAFSSFVKSLFYIALFITAFSAWFWYNPV